jgi:D-glycero-alpha-D-manno-heptose 1-phosphate guanylyltransferase
MEAIILAGGLGTRLSSRLEGIPKPMAPVGGRPFLEILLDRLAAAGCRRVILSVGHLREVIIAAFEGSYRGLELDYVAEEAPLGTGGAIRRALSQARESSVLVLNGDTYLDLDLGAIGDFHRSRRGVMTMAVTEVKDLSRYGGVIVEGEKVTGFLEKGLQGPGWINAGVYVLNRDFPWAQDLPVRFSFETDVLARSLSAINPLAYRCQGYFLDIGVPEDLDRAQTELGGPRQAILP